MARWKFMFDQSACIGCNACQIACKDQKHLEAGRNFRRADTVCDETEGTKRYVHFSGGCHHCENAVCVSACTRGALKQSENGIVTVDSALCGGCGACERACSYGAIYVSERSHTARKCDGCLELLEEGKKPACVEACPVHCLDFCEIEDHSQAHNMNELADRLHFRVNTSKKMKQADLCSMILEESSDMGTTKKQEDVCSELSCFVDFFADRSSAMKLCQNLPDWAMHIQREWELEYDFLFRGTDADCRIPLWASVAAGEQVLLDHTTRDVIAFYHKYGYEPIRMEGNPPDYIGEQLRFLEYLTRCNQWETARSFAEMYTWKTACMVRNAVERRGTFPGFLLLMEQMTELVDSVIKEKRVNGRADDINPEIPNEEPYEILTAGINNCGGICVIRPEMQEGCMLHIRSDCSGNAPQLRACVRGRGYRKTFLHPDRLRYPMKRIGERGSGKFERISWAEAVDLIAEQWKEIRDTYGPGSRYVNYGFGVTGIMLPGRLAKRLLALDGGYLDYFNSYSSACSKYISPYIYGTSECGSSPQDMLNTRLLVLWGDNPAETIFGTERNTYLSYLKKLGIRVIVVDPRMSQTAVAYADQWIGIRPSTDSALADAMAYVIWSEGLQDQAFMDTYCLGFDEEHMPEGVPAGESYRTYLFGEKDGIPRTPEWAAQITGVDADCIRAFAREYAKAKPACIIMGLGPQRHGNGEQTTRSICMLTCLTGNVGIPGGGAAGQGDMPEHENIRLFTNTVSNPYPGKIPVFLWTKAIEHGTEMTAGEDRLEGVEKLDSNIRMLFNLAGNILVNQHADIHDTIRILKDDTKCRFILCSDIFMTPSARYADVLLPATSVFEGNNIVPPWRGGNYLLRNNQVMKPLFECRFEWEWLKEVSEKLGLYEAFIDGMPELEQWLEANYSILRTKEPELPDYETFCKKGGWQYQNQVCHIAFAEEIADPKHHPFATPSGKIEIFSKRLYDFGQSDIPAIPRYISCPEGVDDPLKEKYPLQLIGWHTRRRCHSIHDNNEWQEEVEKPGLWMHPTDAAARGIRDGDLVEVYNDRGRVRIPAIVTERIVPGVTAMSQGGWYTPDPDGVDTRGSINVLTSAAHPTPLAKGNPQHTNLVEVVLA